MIVAPVVPKIIPEVSITETPKKEQEAVVTPVPSPRIALPVEQAQEENTQSENSSQAVEESPRPPEVTPRPPEITPRVTTMALSGNIKVEPSPRTYIFRPAYRGPDDSK